jgi:hypothetical protein
MTTRLFLLAQIVFAAAVLWFAGSALARQWGEAGNSFRALEPRWSLVAASCVLVLASYGVLIQTWRLTLRVWNAQLPALSAARIWFISNLGRYVPGKIWQISAMGVMTHREGVSAVAATSASIMVNLVNIVSGVLVVFATGVGVLDIAVPAGRITAGILVILAIGGLFAVPSLVSWLARRAASVSGRSIELPGSLTPQVVGLGLVGTVAGWLLYGLAFELFAKGILGDAARGSSADYIAVYTASYLVGYLTLIAPGGIGVREAMLVLGLRAAGITSEPDGLVLALSSRVWLTALEVLPGVVLLLIGGRLSPRETDASS